MAPALHTVIYHITMDGEVLADSIVIPVDAINQHPVLKYFLYIIFYIRWCKYFQSYLEICKRYNRLKQELLYISPKFHQ